MQFHLVQKFIRHVADKCNENSLEAHRFEITTHTHIKYIFRGIIYEKCSKRMVGDKERDFCVL